MEYVHQAANTPQAPPKNGARRIPQNPAVVQRQSVGEYPADGAYYEAASPVGAGHNVPRQYTYPGYEQEVDGAAEQGAEVDGSMYSESILDMLPETTIGEAVSIKGSLAFERLLRIDGSFEGELRSGGDLVVGAHGTLHGDVKGMNRVVVDGTVVGDIQCESLEVRNEGFVHGDIVCKSLRVDPTVRMCGRVNVHKDVPKVLNKKGEAVEPEAIRPPENTSKTQNGAPPTNEGAKDTPVIEPAPAPETKPAESS